MAEMAEMAEMANFWWRLERGIPTRCGVGGTLGEEREKRKRSNHDPLPGWGSELKSRSGANVTATTQTTTLPRQPASIHSVSKSPLYHLNHWL